MSTSIEALIPELQQPARALIDLAGRAGVQPRITSTLRTRYEQERLFRRYQQGLNPYPAARPGTSAHEFGWAFDLVVVGTENQDDLGTVWRDWGGVYGGKSDPVHFEYPGFIPPAANGAASRGTGPGARYGSTAGATFVDFLLGFVPGLGEVELIATLATWLGLPQTTVSQLLQAPVSTVRAQYPEVYDAIVSPYSPLFFLNF